MNGRKWAWVVAAAIVAAMAGAAARGWLLPNGAVAQAPRNAGPGAPGGPGGPGGRVVPVETATAQEQTLPVRLDALGTVTPIASVAIKSRIESTISKVHFDDGALVREGDLLFTLDPRLIDALLRQAEGVLAKDRAQLAGAERDFARYTDLFAKGATTQVNVDNAQTQVDVLRATVAADESMVQNLKVQLGYGSIRAPISGRISAAAVKVGNLVRPADSAALAVINQMSPIYVAFALPQRYLGDVKRALAEGTTRVAAFMPNEPEPVLGKVTMIDNSVDVTTGMVTLRATIDNKDEKLWPGTLVNTQLALRSEKVIAVPSVAVQVGQAGNYVFVVKNGAASVRPVKVARTLDAVSVIASGLEAGEVVVTDGQLLLGEGTKVAPRPARTGS